MQHLASHIAFAVGPSEHDVRAWMAFVYSLSEGQGRDVLTEGGREAQHVVLIPFALSIAELDEVVCLLCVTVKPFDKQVNVPVPGLGHMDERISFDRVQFEVNELVRPAPKRLAEKEVSDIFIRGEQLIL